MPNCVEFEIHIQKRKAYFGLLLRGSTAVFKVIDPKQSDGLPMDPDPRAVFTPMMKQLHKEFDELVPVHYFLLIVVSALFLLATTVGRVIPARIDFKTNTYLLTFFQLVPLLITLVLVFVKQRIKKMQIDTLLIEWSNRTGAEWKLVWRNSLQVGRGWPWWVPVKLVVLWSPINKAYPSFGDLTGDPALVV